MRLLYPFLIILLFWGCNAKKSHPKEVINEYTSIQVDKLKQLILSKGDTTAYNDLGEALMNDPYKDEYLVYSLIMANKYKYKVAYFYVYECLIESFEEENEPIDDDIKELALKYIKMGAELKDGNSLLHLSDLYNRGKFVPKDTIMGRKLRIEAKKVCGF